MKTLTDARERELCALLERCAMLAEEEEPHMREIGQGAEDFLAKLDDLPLDPYRQHAFEALAAAFEVHPDASGRVCADLLRRLLLSHRGIHR